jgi:hypothetical protein
MRRMRPLHIALTCAVAIFLANCGKNDLETRIRTASAAASVGLVRGVNAQAARQAAKLLDRDPIGEADEAAKKRDYRLIGVAGIGLFFPGVKTEEAPRTRLGVRETMGAGDTVNYYTGLYQSEAYQFALAYNQRLLEGMRTQRSR